MVLHGIGHGALSRGNLQIRQCRCDHLHFTNTHHELPLCYEHGDLALPDVLGWPWTHMDQQVTWPHVIRTAPDQGDFPHSSREPKVMAHQEDDINPSLPS
jgi:hypothetical protein